MRTSFILIAASLAVSGCFAEMDAEMQRESQLLQACEAARTYGDRYGTPENRGPCWDYTTTHSVGFGVESFIVHIRGTRYGTAVLTYRGNRLISATESFGF